MDHLAPSSGVNWYTNNNAFGELSTAAPHLPSMELGGVDYGRPYNTQAYVHYPTPSEGLYYEQDPLSDSIAVKDEEYWFQEKTLTPAHSKVSSQVRAPVGEKIACHECGATFACSANLRNHMRIHTGERPFVCEECGASFTQRSNMHSHKRVHTGERPYMCGICGQTFARSSHLPGHMRTHTGEKPFICSHCGRSFATNQIMKNHIRTHTGERPFVCPVCSATFAQSSCLATHKKIHTGERSFKCGNCGKAFISRSGLQTHERVHTGEKPYSCDRCSKSFRTSSYLSKHRQKYCSSEVLHKSNKQPKANKPAKKTANSHKLRNRKTTSKQRDHPLTKKGKLKVSQNLKEIKKKSTFDSLTDSELCKTQEGNAYIKMEESNSNKESFINPKLYKACERDIILEEINLAKESYGNDESITTIMSTNKIDEETLPKGYVQEKMCHPSTKTILADSKSTVAVTQYLAAPCRCVSSAMEDSDNRIKEHKFAHVEDGNGTVIPHRLIGNYDNSIPGLTCCQREEVLHEVLKRDYKEESFNNSLCSIQGSHSKAMQLGQVFKKEHVLISNYYKEIDSSGFAEGAYEEIQNPPLLVLQKSCEGLPQLTIEAFAVPQQSCAM